MGSRGFAALLDGREVEVSEVRVGGMVVEDTAPLRGRPLSSAVADYVRSLWGDSAAEIVEVYRSEDLRPIRYLVDRGCGPAIRVG